jgi:hypothetical protein
MAKIGRPTVLGRPMTGAERMRRHRYMQGWIAAYLKKIERKYSRPRVEQQSNWNRVAPPDMLGNELAFACFDLGTHTADWDRWNAIDAQVRKHLAELETEFPVSSRIM